MNGCPWAAAYNIFSHIFYDTHHLVPDRYSRYGTRHATMFDMEIAGTNTSKSHPHNRITRIFQPGFRLFLQFKFTGFNVCICQHNIILIIFQNFSHKDRRNGFQKQVFFVKQSHYESNSNLSVYSMTTTSYVKRV